MSPLNIPLYRTKRSASVTFKSEDSDVQNVFEAAESKLALNIIPFTSQLNILIEGGGIMPHGLRPSRWEVRCMPRGIHKSR